MNNAIATYLAKHGASERRLASGPLDGIDQVVVIPVLAEKDYLFHTLDSLAACPAADLARTLVLCVINHREDADPTQIADNRATMDAVQARMDGGALRLAYIDAASPGAELPAKEGVGLARKIGMDAALSVFAEGGRGPRLILSLDADTLVEPNYLDAVRAHFSTTGAWAAVVDYAHPLDGSDAERAAILCYEFYLRYHELGLRFAGSPYAYPAIGSTMVCRDDAYAAAGGMNRRQGGEDFYFLQQLAKTGGVSRIRATTVHPSGRVSERAPLGTGQRVLRYLGGGHDEYLLYHPESYALVKAWLALAETRWDAHARDLLFESGDIHEELRRYLRDAQFVEVWERLRKNSKTAEQMRQQFHGWFDAFRTLKLLHHLRDNGYPPQEMFGAFETLFAWTGQPTGEFTWAALRDDTIAQTRLLERLRGMRD